MKKLNALDWISLVLVIIGGLNWGLIAVFKWNLVSAIFGSVAWLETIIYALVGLAAIWMIVIAAKLEKK
ncbi:MAG: DUF378 domain-containing protein [Parcubacteria group bacterium]